MTVQRQLVVLVVLDTTSNQLTKSTGMKSATLSSLHMIVWKIPFPTADTMPVGPFQLSTHPLSGSLTLDNTTTKRVL